MKPKRSRSGSRVANQVKTRLPWRPIVTPWILLDIDGLTFPSTFTSTINERTGSPVAEPSTSVVSIRRAAFAILWRSFRHCRSALFDIHDSPFHVCLQENGWHYAPRGRMQTSSPCRRHFCRGTYYIFLDSQLVATKVFMTASPPPAKESRYTVLER